MHFWKNKENTSFGNVFVQAIVTEHLLCVKSCVQGTKNTKKNTAWLCLQGAHSLEWAADLRSL